MRILLIDDDVTNAQFLHALLTRVVGDSASCEVRRATRIFDALQTIDEEHAFDVILLDLGLPECDGLTSLKLILAHATGVPVVVVTGTDNPEITDGAFRAGACDFLIKGRFGAPRLEQALAKARAGRYPAPDSHQLRGAFLHADGF